jgi:hypothetical protein
METFKKGAVSRRVLAPGVTENPIFMHLTDTTPKGVRKAVDQCAEVRFRKRIPLSLFAMPFCTKNASLYQDRLGTNIGKALKKRDAVAFSCRWVSK